MSIWEAIVLGVVQGLTEFLPVSSSGHLQIAKEILGVTIPDNLSFDVTLHAATVLSTIVVFWSEIVRLARGFFSTRYNDDMAYVLKILLSMIPIGIIGFAFKDQLNEMLSSSYILIIVGAMLLLTACLLGLTHFYKPRQKDKISYRDAFVIGLAQACAAMPGLSRSGTTIATGLLLGNQKAAVAQFSFLMVLLPIIGETALQLLGGEFAATETGVGIGALLAGFVASFVVGYLACRFMIGVVKRGKLIWFAAYCLVMGAACIVYGSL